MAPIALQQRAAHTIAGAELLLDDVRRDVLGREGLGLGLNRLEMRWRVEIHQASSRTTALDRAPRPGGSVQLVRDHVELPLRVGERGNPGLGPPVVELNVTLSREAVAAMNVETVLRGRVRHLGSEDIRHRGERLPGREGLVEGPARLPGQELRAVLGHESVRQGVRDRLIGPDPNAECLALACVRGTDLYRLAGQSDQCCGTEDAHLVESSEEKCAGAITLGQDFHYPHFGPAGQRQGSHVGCGAYVGRPGHSDNSIGLQREHDVGDGPIRQQLLFHWAWTSGEGHDADSLEYLVEKLSRAAGGQQACGRCRFGEGNGGDATPGLFGNQREFEQATSTASDALGDSHPQGAGGDHVGPEVRVMAQGLCGAHPGRIRLLAEEGGERLPDELLLLGQCKVHASNPSLQPLLDPLRVRE